MNLCGFLIAGTVWYQPRFANKEDRRPLLKFYLKAGQGGIERVQSEMVNRGGAWPGMNAAPAASGRCLIWSTTWIFRAWQRPGRPDALRVYYTVQTIEQMRNTSPVSLQAPPATAVVFLPGCSQPEGGAPCDWSDFQKIAGAQIMPIIFVAKRWPLCRCGRSRAAAVNRTGTWERGGPYDLWLGSYPRCGSAWPRFVDDVHEGDLWLFPGGVPHSIQGLGPDGCMFLRV
jgi:hypothetical protein